MRCKICNTKFEVKFFNQKTCFDPSCVLEFSKKQKLKNWEKQSRKQSATKKVKKKTTKEYLQDNINKLAKMIDTHFDYNCICCGNIYKGQVDACHYKSRGNNLNLAYNLHNIHKGRAYCNQYSNLHIIGYKDGLINRYSLDYFNYIDAEIGIKYSYLGLNETELKEALRLTRKCIREFDSLIKGFKNGKDSRDFFNKSIGIYI